MIVIGSRGLTGVKKIFDASVLAAGRRARRPAGADRAAATLTAVDRHAVRRLPPEPNPALVRHGQERAQSVQNRIADHGRRPDGETPG